MKILTKRHSSFDFKRDSSMKNSWPGLADNRCRISEITRTRDVWCQVVLKEYTHSNSIRRLVISLCHTILTIYTILFCFAINGSSRPVSNSMQNDFRQSWTNVSATDDVLIIGRDVGIENVFYIESHFFQSPPRTESLKFYTNLKLRFDSNNFFS